MRKQFLALLRLYHRKVHTIRPSAEVIVDTSGWRRDAAKLLLLCSSSQTFTQSRMTYENWWRSLENTLVPKSVPGQVISASCHDNLPLSTAIQLPFLNLKTLFCTFESRVVHESNNRHDSRPFRVAVKRSAANLCIHKVSSFTAASHPGANSTSRPTPIFHRSAA